MPRWTEVRSQHASTSRPRCSRNGDPHGTDRWIHASDSTRAPRPGRGLLVAVLVAYNYSLTTLLQNAGQDTPLAYVSLVPAIALALAAIRARPLKPEPPIHDRQVDYTVGHPADRGGHRRQRVAAGPQVHDVLGLSDRPVHTAVLRGRGRGDHLRRPGPVAPEAGRAYLFLAWPYPYQSVLLRVLNGFTAATILGINQVCVTFRWPSRSTAWTTPSTTSTTTGHRFL